MIFAQLASIVTSSETIACVLAALAGAVAALALNRVFQADQQSKDGRRKRISHP